MSVENGVQTAAEVDAEQNRMMEEECILVDWDDKPVGSATKRVCHKVPAIREGMLHRAFSVFLFNSAGELLLQQRAGCKITFPLRWTNTCCSHPLHGYNDEFIEENAVGVKRAAIRKLEHELGISNLDVSQENLHWLTRIHYGAASDETWGEHEIDWILFLQTDLPASTANGTVPLPVNPNECEAIRWVNPEQLQAMMDESKSGKGVLLTPWFGLIAEQLLFPWWKNLKQIIENDGLGEEQRKVIHRLQEKPHAV